MTGKNDRLARSAIKVWTVIVLLFLYAPMAAVVLASFAQSRYFSFPIRRWTTEWYADTLSSLSVRDMALTSITVAAIVTVLSVVLAFFGALAFARYEWKGRKLYQKLILLPIFFPQAVLGLALLLWLSTLGVIPTWQTAVFAHMVWIVPIVTLIMSIQVYGFDPALEEAAIDMGASRLQTLREVTLPILSPGIISGAVFAFLLSWGNFPLSLFSTGADQTIPEWLYSKMVSGYTPVVPALGSLMMGAAVMVLFVAYVAFTTWRHRHRLLGPKDDVVAELEQSASQPAPAG